MRYIYIYINIYKYMNYKFDVLQHKIAVLNIIFSN